MLYNLLGPTIFSLIRRANLNGDKILSKSIGRGKADTTAGLSLYGKFDGVSALEFGRDATSSLVKLGKHRYRAVAP